MLPKVELVRIRKLSEVVDDSILFLKQNYRPLLKAYFYICGMFWVAGIASAMLSQTQMFQLQARGESAFSYTFIITMVLVYINFLLTTLTTLSYISLYQQYDKQPPSVADVWSYVKYYFLRLLGSAVVLLIINALAFLLCFFPGIYCIPLNMLIITVMVIENAGLRYSYNRANQLISKNWWTLVSSLLVITFVNVAALVLICIPVSIIFFLIYFFAHMDDKNAFYLALSFTVSFAQVLYLLPVIVTALSFYSFNEQQDDNSLLKRINMLGTTTAHNPDDLPLEEY
ncbi:hypothetical protein EWM62_18260 [Mucilaginibacter terrigena]|uniref:Glycerophosphoryl diester phosphodiesterase membrane domain-containing protein n=1 Tax=Mucilaginibacter terrigena TaxID=2492395 RepID=A0A4Q5LIW8_9SPHI|nr:hypothetical protein [Mucilaginibacter terrigena]RYU86151.1 hypothetical protein EWM62_18260 [Mucilaginibacter terrigena]